MVLNSWRKWLNGISRNSKGKSVQDRRQPLRKWYRRLEFERLEARLAPATSITVLPGVSGSGSQDAAFLGNNGQLLFNAPDVGANTLSTGALAAVASTNNIVVQATDHIT